MAGQATGYSDFYKRKAKTPGSWDDEENDEMKETIVPRGAKTKSGVPTTAEERKQALQRRLKRLRAGK